MGGGQKFTPLADRGVKILPTQLESGGGGFALWVFACVKREGVLKEGINFARGGFQILHTYFIGGSKFYTPIAIT